MSTQSGKRTPIFGPIAGFADFHFHGRYSLYISRASLPKFAAGNREKGTADENKRSVGGVISHIGRYTVDEKDKTFTFHVESSTYPTGTGQPRSGPSRSPATS